MIDSLPYTQMTGGAPPNTFGKVTIKVTKPGLQFDWSATLGIDAVIVKVKDSSNVYVYSPEACGAQALQARRLADTVKIEFCHDYELASTKTANTAYTRTYSWTISKTVDDDSHAGYPGMSFKPTYTVSVDQTVMESDFLVSGKITVTNPTLWGPVTFTPSDVVGSTPVSVKCDTYTIAAGKTATCLYSAGLSGKDDGVGTASVTVRDDVQGYLGTASQDKTFPQYSGRFACSTSAADYINGVDEDTYTNTSSIDETQQTASASVTVTCEAAFVDLLKWTDGVVNPDRGVGVHAPPRSGWFRVEADGWRQHLRRQRRNPRVRRPGARSDEDAYGL